MIQTLSYIINVAPEGVPQVVKLSQNENGRTLAFTLTGAGTVSIPSGATVTISGTKPDGVVYSATGTLSGNVASFAETTQMTAVSGIWPAKIKVTYNGETIATCKVVMAIDPDPVAPGSVPSNSPLNGLVAEAQQYATYAKYEAFGSPLVASTVAGMTDKTRVYVYTGSETGYTSGHWYYWNGSAWTDGGVYNSQGINTDTTLSIAGMAADAKATGDEISVVKSQFNIISEMPENLAIPDFNAKTMTISDGQGTVTVSNVFNVVAGHTYYVYAKVKITDLTSWTSGVMVARLIHGVNAGSTDGTLTIANNGEYVLCKNLTPNASGTVKVTVWCYSQTPSTNSFTVTLEKLFVVESNNDLRDICDNATQADHLLVKVNIPDKTITRNMLTPDALTPPTDKTIIDCWGDSLTAGAGSTSYPYPTKLQALIGSSATVNNYGQGGEVAEAVAFRQGAIGAMANPFTVGAVNANVTVSALNSVDGKNLGTLSLQGTYYGNNIVYIDGARFMYRRKDDDECYMINLVQGNVGKVYTRPMLVNAEGKGTGHIIIICVGQNGYGTSDPVELANLIELMVEHNNSSYYLVLGIPSGDSGSRAEMETILATRFGNHFVNTRKYISEYGLSDNSLTPTTEDTEAMSIGAIPPSLRVDNVHMNDYGYIAMANCVYARGISLGYWA